MVECDYNLSIGHNTRANTHITTIISIYFCMLHNLPKYSIAIHEKSPPYNQKCLCIVQVYTTGVQCRCRPKLFLAHSRSHLVKIYQEVYKY